MIWASWRQHRGQAIACLALLVVLAVYAIVLGTSMRSAFSHDALAGCLARSQGTALAGRDRGLHEPVRRSRSTRHSGPWP